MCRANSDVFPGSLHSNTDIVTAMIVADAVKETHSVGTAQPQWHWQSVGEPHDAIVTVSDELSLESLIKSLLQSLASIPQIYQSIFQINRPEIASHFVKPPPKTQNCLLGTMQCALRRKVRGCVPDVRIEVSRAAWSKHWRQCVWLTCLTLTRATLASRCSKRTARHAATTAEMWDGRPRDKYILWFVIVRASAIWNLVARHISRWSVRASER